MRKIISILLILLMLTTHMGFAIGTHLCGGLAVETKMMIGHEHMDCGMGDVDKDCKSDSDSKTHLSKIPCCENDYVNLEVEDEFKPNVAPASLNVEFVAAFVFSYLEVFSTDQENTQFTAYDPPLVIRDISILHQVFLI